MSESPFRYGSRVSDEHFIGRKRELRRVSGRIHKGESTAIVGDPHIGKTSFLYRLMAEEKSGESENRYLSLVDTDMFGSQLRPAQFWEQALSPIKEQMDKGKAPALVKDHYEICRKNCFGNITLERFFTELKKAEWQFVLLIDEFDKLLHHKILNNAEFYGGLRSLASRSGEAFTLVIASRSQISRLNQETQEFNPTGSPFFNIFGEVELPPFSEKEVNELLFLGKEKFQTQDKKAISRLGGRHPFLLQAAADAMWRAHEDEDDKISLNRMPFVTKSLYDELDYFFYDMWQSWSPEIRKAFTAVGIVHQAHILQDRFRLREFAEELPRLAPELSDLERKGILAPHDRYAGGYCAEPEIMLTWLADELIKAGRTEDEFGKWVQDRGLEGVFTKGEKEKYKKAALAVGKYLDNRIMRILEAVAGK